MSSPIAIEQIQYRKVKTADVELFKALRLKAFRTDPDVFVSTFEEEKNFPLEKFSDLLDKNYVLGAFDGIRLIGTLMYMEQEKQKFRHIGILGGMYVDPGCRNLGIGRKLVSIMLQNLQRLDHLQALQLKVITTNLTAIRLYESFGFSSWACERNALQHDGRFFDQHHMALALRS